MYQRPDLAAPGGEADKSMDPRKIQEHYEDFYEDLFEELSKYGDIESLNVCDNVADHMVRPPSVRSYPCGYPCQWTLHAKLVVFRLSLQVGNVYVNFREEEQAATALRALTGRFYAGACMQRVCATLGGLFTCPTW